jgi:hypothetical protein
MKHTPVDEQYLKAKFSIKHKNRFDKINVLRETFCYKSMFNT